ncbi:MAG: GIY-YIG nuclease family protein [Deltaproteobacteria bacterium]|nr:GIY-YIG nuclease family protein [Deltaproteobacteria bacterium]
MDWQNERYVRLYTRETPDDLVLSPEARLVWYELIRKFDRAGVIDLGRHGTRALSALLRVPLDWVEQAIPELCEDGRIELRDSYIVAPNFMDAQEAKQSDRQRQRESRARRRDRVRAGVKLERKVGAIYVAVTATDKVKVGFSSEPQERIKTLRSYHPDIEIVGLAADRTLDDEQSVHRELAPYSIGKGGEWFGPAENVLPRLSELLGITLDRSPGVTRGHEGGDLGHTNASQCHSSLASLAKPSQPSRANTNARSDQSSDQLDDTSDRPRNGYDFEALYKLWPRKIAKKKALEACGAKITTRAKYEQLRAAVEEISELWKNASKEAVQFCPYMSTYVNQERWNDGELPTPSKGRGNSHGGGMTAEEIAQSARELEAQGR